jgi:hypothetical protein
MGHYNDTTVEVIFNGSKVRVSQGVADSLKANGSLDVKKKKEAKTNK